MPTPYTQNPRLISFSLKSHLIQRLIVQLQMKKEKLDDSFVQRGLFDNLNQELKPNN